jgi:hypothetical protein
LNIALVGNPVALLHLDTTRTAQNLLPLGISNLRLLNGAPILSVAINNAIAGDGYVLGTISTQRRLTATRVETFERGSDDGIECFVARELDNGTYLKMEVYI